MALGYTNRVIGPESGTSISYNGILFPPAVSVQFHGEPVQDSAGRTNTSTKYTIRIEGIWTNEDSTTPTDFPTDFLTLSNKLMKSRGSLVFSGYPLGVATNASPLTTLNYGPHPKSFDYRVLGGQTIYFVWVCEWEEPNCDTNIYPVGEFLWSVSFGIKENGMTTRSIRGHLKMRGYADSDGNISSIVESYRGNIVFPRLPNFHRTQNWEVSEDKRTLTFQITDTEIESDNPYFPSMVHMRVREKLSSSMVKGGLVQWEMGISGEIEVAPGIPRFMAWLAFLAIVQSRLAAMSQYGPTTINGVPIPVSRINPRFSFTNDIYGRTVGFDIGYTLICGIDLILQASGIWRAVPGTNWQQWATSMEVLQNNRGYAQLSTQASDDVIVDYCTPLRASGGAPATNIPSLQFQTETALDPGCPVVWHQFKNELHYGRVTNATELIPYSPNGGDLETVLDTSEVNSQTGGQPSQGGQARITYVQERGGSSTYLTMMGYGVRQSAKVPIPKIKSIGGQTPKLVEEDVTGSTLLGTTSNGCPIFIAKWRRVYYLPQGADGKNVEFEGVPDGFRAQG